VTKTEKAIIEAAYAYENVILYQECAFCGERLTHAVIADKRAKKGVKK
jgi:hypothetical protein